MIPQTEDFFLLSKKRCSIGYIVGGLEEMQLFKLKNSSEIQKVWGIIWGWVFFLLEKAIAFSSYVV